MTRPTPATPPPVPPSSAAARFEVGEAWRGARVYHREMAPDEVLDHVAPHYAIDVHLSHPYHLEWKCAGRFRRTWMTPGDLCISPAHESLSMRWRDNLEIITVALDPALLAHVADDMKLGSRVAIPERHGDVDHKIAHLCRALWAESQAARPGGRVYEESLATALAARLLQRFNAHKAQSPLEGKLSPRCWHIVRDFIEANLGGDMSLHEIAGVAGLSPYHFARCFKATAGVAPHQYIIARRIELARRLLTSSTVSVSQVAAQCGFVDQSHLTRHMKRHLGVTPAKISGLQAASQREQSIA